MFVPFHILFNLNKELEKVRIKTICEYRIFFQIINKIIKIQILNIVSVITNRGGA